MDDYLIEQGGLALDSEGNLWVNDEYSFPLDRLSAFVDELVEVGVLNLEFNYRFGFRTSLSLPARRKKTSH